MMTEQDADIEIGLQKVKINRYKNAAFEHKDDVLIVEVPLEMRIRQKGRSSQLAITMRTPGNDDLLMQGYLLAEGIISDLADIQSIRSIDENVIEAELLSKANCATTQNTRNTYVSSSCGLCGKTSLEALRKETHYLPWASKAKIAQQSILHLQNTAMNQQRLFSRTGGNHAVTLFDYDAQLLGQYEDVGRHNAMDKLIGHALKHDMLPLHGNIALLSGRASFELIQKAMMAGLSMVAAVGAPSSMAVELADEAGITLIGFLRDESYNVYCHGDRIV